jgi:hypothetical protein
MTKKHMFYYIIAMLAAVFFTGCARVYHVTVDSIRGTDTLPGKNYVIVSGNSAIDTNDLQFREYAGYVARALTEKGMTLVDDISRADMEIYLTYGIGDAEQHVYSYAEPVWGQTGSETSATTNVSREGGVTSVVQDTVTTPAYGVTGYQTKTDTYTTYPKFITIDAYDLVNHPKSNKLIQLWKTSITASGQSRELRKIFAGMVAAASTYISENTGEAITVNIEADSDKVNEIKGITK